MWKFFKQFCKCNTTPTNTSNSNVCSDGLSTNDYQYTGPDLTCTNINNGDSLTVAFQKISHFLCSREFTSQVIETITDNINEYPEFITILNNSVECDTITNCLTTTTTIAPLTECSTFARTSQAIYSYDYVQNSFNQILPTEAMAGTGLANTSTKLWTMLTFGQITEYDITFNPFTITFVREIQNNTQNGLAAINNTKLLGALNGKLYEIDITSNIASLTELVTFPNIGGLYGTDLNGDIIFTSTNKIICSVQAQFAGSPNYIATKILQYNYPSMTLEAIIDLPLNLSQAWGLSVYNNEFYIFNSNIIDGNNLYKISTVYPYTVTLVDSLEHQVTDASVNSSCVDISFEPNITTITTTTEAPVFCEGNLAVNPTFDTNLSGWVNETGEWAWVSTWGGSACYRGLDSLGRLSQDILTPGESYNLSFTMHNNTTCTENGYIMVEAGTNSYGPFTTSGTSVVSIVITAAVNGKLTFIGDDSCLAEEIFDRLWIDNVCVTLIPTTTTTSTTILTTTTTTTLEPTTTTTTTDIPTTTTTSTTEFAGMLHLSLISASSNPTDACPLPLVDTVYIWKNDPGDVPTQGDRIYLDALMTTPFTGDNNYWHITIQSSTFTVSAEVDSLGFISSSFISLCV